MQIFKEVLFFQTTYNRKIEKQTICFDVVHSLEKRTSSNARFVQLISILFNLLCIFDHFDKSCVPLVKSLHIGHRIT